MALTPIPEILDELRQGRMVILVDDPDRENEGDLIMLAEHVTAADVNFMAKEGRGLICMPMSGEMVDRLGLVSQVRDNTSRMGTAFTNSIEAAQGVTTGISAGDRAHTIQVASGDGAGPEDLATPGHIFPLRARDGGVLVRGGQTEGTVDLARLSGSKSHSGMICEIMNDDGTMARMPDLELFAEKHGLSICTISDLVSYRRKHERLIEPVVMEVPIPSHHGAFTAHLFRSIVDGNEHIALTRGVAEPGLDGPCAPIDGVVSVRVHSECLTGDVFGSKRCDCEPQLHRAMDLLAEEEHSVLLYLRQEGRGIGLANKLRAYKLQDQGMDTVEANQALGFPADLREYGLGAQILHYLGVRKMRIFTNNPKKIHGLAGYGLELVEQVPLRIEPGEENARYLETKRQKLGHMLEDSKAGE